MLTREEFTEYYIKNRAQYSGKTETAVREMVQEFRHARPCNCDDEGCQGWQMVSDEAWEDIQELHPELALEDAIRP